MDIFEAIPKQHGEGEKKVPKVVGKREGQENTFERQINNQGERHITREPAKRAKVSFFSRLFRAVISGEWKTEPICSFFGQRCG